MDRCERPSLHLRTRGACWRVAPLKDRYFLHRQSSGVISQCRWEEGGVLHFELAQRQTPRCRVCRAFFPRFFCRRRQERPAIADNYLSTAAFYFMCRRCEKVCCHCLKYNPNKQLDSKIVKTCQKRYAAGNKKIQTTRSGLTQRRLRSMDRQRGKPSFLTSFVRHKNKGANVVVDTDGGD